MNNQGNLNTTEYFMILRNKSSTFRYTIEIVIAST
jgi:hypothetical protein